MLAINKKIIDTQNLRMIKFQYEIFEEEDLFGYIDANI